MVRAPELRHPTDDHLAPAIQITGVKVFSATKAREREALGEVITAWIQQHPSYRLVDKIVTQSSDAEYHCLTITMFYRDAA
jgi:hypothetical protein